MTGFNLKTSPVDGMPEEPEKDKKPVIEYKEITDFADLDLGRELLQSYNRASRLFTTIEFDDDIPPNQKAQVLNTIRNIQEQVLRSQERFHNVERLKNIENVLINTLKDFPELKNSFLEAYEQAGLAQEGVKNA